MCRRLALVLCALAACGGETFPVGPALPIAANVTVLAHQDDDLLFMQPDLTDLVEARAGLLNVYVTAGDGGTPVRAPDPLRPPAPGQSRAPDGIETAQYRYEGLTKAYAQAAGLASTWTCGWIEIAGHPAEHCRLDEANVSLVFLAYPDGGKEGEAPDSLLHLWDGTSSGADTISLRTTHYDQASLIATVAEVITTAQPQTIRTLEISATHGRDHSDHMLVGALTTLAAAAAGSQAALIAYRGYDIEEEPETLIDDLYDRSVNLLAHYDACATGCSTCGTACPAISPSHAIWLRRRYAVGMRRTAAGVLRGGGMCVGINTDGTPTFGPCPVKPTHWELTADGHLRTLEGRCLGALLTGELVTSASCSNEPRFRFFLDDEGHFWLGVPPLAEASMDYAHLMCLGVAGGRPRASLCGKDRAPRWELSETPVSTPRVLPPLPGRAVRLADLTGDGRADLCFADAGVLRCAAGRGDGTFDPPVQLATLAIEPESLVLGDVDGDRRADACGRAPDGLRCALSSAAFGEQMWSPTFARTGPADATDRSLGAADTNGDGVAELCGLGEQGVVCVPRGLGALTQVRSRWPAPDAPMWSGDLDGDQRADWCVARPSGPACGLDRDRDLTTDGAPWSFAQSGSPDPSPASPAVGALADLDGDGRADLCTLRDRAIVCARSSGHGFGPQTVFATLPPGGPLTALWLGDLDGDGRVDACVEDGVMIICVGTVST
ncbi:MAG: VCBS repeat-containing protein [Myxococcales bacterium]|nr:VCBS repeat-containing protein [Myxococcales bacterium]